MNRRELILCIGSLIVLPRALRAQQKAMPKLGYLNPGFPADVASFAAAFRQGLSEAGYVEGQNLAIEYRWAEAAMIGHLRWPPNSSPARLT